MQGRSSGWILRRRVGWNLLCDEGCRGVAVCIPFKVALIHVNAVKNILAVAKYTKSSLPHADPLLSFLGLPVTKL